MPTQIAKSFSGNFFSRHLAKQMAEVLPRRFKRLLYVSSAMGLLLKEKKPDIELVTRINNKLHLAYGSAGMLFPIYIGTIIWKDLMTNIISLQIGTITISEIDPSKLNDIDCWRTGLYFARHTPSWLQYGSDQLMAADVHDLIVALKKAA